MIRKIVYLFASVFLTFGFALTSCDSLGENNSTSNSESTSETNDGNSATTHEHTFASSWEHDETYHWHPSTCGHDVKSNEEEHTFASVVTDPTYESGGYTTYTCSVCGYSYTDSETSPLSITITWQNYDGTILEVDEDVPYGSMPSYDGETPRRDGNGQYSYTFSGWSPEISEVVCDVTYVAQFSYEDDLTYTLNLTNDGYLVSKGSNSANYIDIVIPDKHDNLPVTGIGDSAFHSCSSLISIYIPSSVTSIDSYAFYGCTSLTSIYIPSSVTTIGDYVFRNCSNLTIYCEVDSKLEGWSNYWNNSDLPVVWNSYKGIHGNLNGLEYTAYHDNEGNPYIVITEYNGSAADVVIPSSINVNGEDIPVKAIADNAFYNNKKIRSVIIPDSVTTIGGFAFYNCSSLISIYIPDSVTTIGSGAFYSCSNLTTVTFGENSQLTSIGENAFYKCISLTSIYIPNSVTTIGSSAFYSCSNLTTVTFGENSQLTSIGENAFYKCISLTSIYIPDSVTTIGSRVFYSCSNLTTVTISENSQLTTIEAYAFYYCSSLTSIYIPDSVTTIGSRAFYSCSNLTTVTISENSQLTSIGENAFQYCSSLTSIYIPDSVTTIGGLAFYNCSKLKTVTISENSQLITIGNYAFRDCSSLISIYIPNSVTTIGYSAFKDCTNLTIYCEASYKPSGWDSDWNYSNCPVVWNTTYDDYLASIAEYQ